MSTNTAGNRRVRTRSTTRTITRDRQVARGAISPRVRAVYGRRVANYESARRRARR
jgi:hypothetical protein